MHQPVQDAAQRGMQLAAMLPDIMPPQASERIRPVYQDIQDVLRVPIVNRLFRTLANYPGYLVPAWQQIRSVACLRVFEQSADALRISAVPDDLPGAATPAGKQPHDIETLRAFNDTIHYVLPKLLLIATALVRSPTDPEVDVPSPRQVNDLSTIPAGAAEGTAKVELIEPDKASDRVRALFEQVKQRHAHPLVSSYYRGLANWPDFLEAAWETVGPRIGTAQYHACKAALIEAAQAQVRNWPQVTVQIDQRDAADIEAILAAFANRFIPEMLLDVTLIKGLLDGTDAPGKSRFSVA